MITINLSAAILLYCGFILLGFAALWLTTELSVKHTQRLLEKQHLWRCAYCGYVYLDEAAEMMSGCPQCHSINAVDEAQDRAVRQEKERAAEAHPKPESEPAEEVEDPRRNPSHRKRTRGATRGPRRRR